MTIIVTLHWCAVNDQYQVQVALLLLAAFGEYKDTGLNMPPSTPAPCLKIRNMFDLDM